MESIRILHAAGLALDAPFEALGAAKVAAAAALTRTALTDLVRLSHEKKADVVLLGPDTLQNGYASAETVSFFRECMEALAPICTVIVPGRRDAFSSASLYAGMRFSSHVRMFHESVLRKVSVPHLPVTVYGRACLEDTACAPLTVRAEQDERIHLYLSNGTETAEELAAFGAHVAFMHGEQPSLTQTEEGNAICTSASVTRRDFTVGGTGSAMLLTLTQGEDGTTAAETEELRLFPLHYETVHVSLDGVSSTDDVAKALSRAMADAACDAHTVLRVIFEGMLPLDFPMYALKNAISACEKDLFHVCMTDATHPDLAHRFCGDGAARGLTLHSELVRAATEQAAVQEADVLRAASAALEGRSLGDAL